jgi:hypothetical protein
MNVIKTLALSFLDDTLPQAIFNLNTRKLERKDNRSWYWASKPKQGLVGQPGDIVIHRGGLDIDTEIQIEADREAEPPL